MFNHKNKGTKQHVCINYADIPFDNEDDSRRTLDPSYLGYHWATGWNINGIIEENEGFWLHERWVGDFVATNRVTGDWVRGNFEGMVYASSEEALDEFLCQFPYEEWEETD